MIYTGDCLEILPTLEAESVQCCVTSPPYYGLRDYGTATWEGGDPGCDHSHFLGGNGDGDASAKQVTSGGTQKYQYRDVCPKCCATRIDSQIGLEASPELYVAKLVEVFRQVKRVLRDDGTVWLNLGDSYANDTKWGGTTGGKHAGGLHGEPIGRGKRDTGLKAKDLIGIPWRVAFALQADGWYLRSDIIWHKPNPMPESVTDRPTKAHEYIFLLTKSARYFYDAEAIKEPADGGGILRDGFRGEMGAYVNQQGPQNNSRPSVKRGGFNGKTEAMADTGQNAFRAVTMTRNRRSVWTITTKPFKEAHFATFPPEIPEICIKAGSRPGDTILDPFSGAGTTGNVAERLGREYIGIELNPAYADMGEKRIEAARLPLFREATPCA